MFDVLDKLVSEKAIEDGIWHHIYREDAEGGQVPIYADADKEHPCMVLIRSIRSAAIRKFNTKNQAKSLTQIRRGKPGDVEGAEKDISAADLEGFALRCLALKNCDSTQPADSIQMLTPSQAMELAQRSNYQWLVEQVFKVSADDAKYGAEGASAGEPKKAASPKG